MTPVDLRVLAINGGSSSIKFALFEASAPLQRIFHGAIDGIGRPGSALWVKGPSSADNVTRPLPAPDHAAAVSALLDWLVERLGADGLAGVRHRVVHGGTSYSEPRPVTADLVRELRRLSPFDPGLSAYLARTENMSSKQFHELVNFECGLLGISETSGDIRDLLDCEARDVRAAEAVAPYQIKKWIGAFAAAVGGIDTLVFAGGIGENAPAIRARVCDGLEFLGVELEPDRNTRNEALISGPNSRVTVRVIRTDEEHMIAKAVCRVLGERWREEN